MRTLATALIVLFAACSLASCSSTPAAKGPMLVSFQDRQRSRIEGATTDGTYGSIADKLAALPAEQYAGSDIAISEVILNEGLPSKGIRLTVKGSAVADGLLGLPKEAVVRGEFADKKRQAVECPIEFVADNTGGWQASVPDIYYGTQMEINIITPAVKGGQGDCQLFVYPLDSKGTSSAVIAHNYKILDERAPEDIQVPTD